MYAWSQQTTRTRTRYLVEPLFPFALLPGLKLVADPLLIGQQLLQLPARPMRTDLICKRKYQ
jgi:hypothetical protein